MQNPLSFKNALLAITVLAAFIVKPTALFAADPQSAAATEPPIFKEKRCYACHAMEKTLIGPPYPAIAAVHKPNKDVMRDVLVQKILKGGGGNWGLVPMVPNEHVTEEEAGQMVDWILDLQAN